MRIFRNISFALLACSDIARPVAPLGWSAAIAWTRFHEAFYEFAGRRVGWPRVTQPPGLDELNAGRADRRGDARPRNSNHSRRIARFRSAIIACWCWRRSSPLDHITLAQLASVFQCGPIRWWRRGGNDSGSLRGRRRGDAGPRSGNRRGGYFRQAVLGGRDFRANVVRFADAGVGGGLLAEHRVGARRRRAAVPAISVGGRGGAKSPAVAPTENLQAGTSVAAFAAIGLQTGAPRGARGRTGVSAQR